MIEVIGMKFDKNFLPNFIFVKNLQYFEGTLLAEYKTETGDSYIFHWCDCSDTLNRWLVIRISKRSLFQFNSGLSSLHHLLDRDNLDNTYYLLDMDTNQKIEKCFLVQKYSINSEYFPEEDSFIMPELIPNIDKNSYPILIDKYWSSEDLSSFPKKFIDAHNLINAYVNNFNIDINDKWNGGYSSQKFYGELKRNNKKIGIKSIQYASPGYIQFSAKRDISLLVKKNLDAYIKNKDNIDSTFKLLLNYIKEHNLNNKKSNEISNIELEYLVERGKKLMFYFSEPKWSWLLENSSDEFKATKVAMSFYRRIKPLAEQVISEKAFFGDI